MRLEAIPLTKERFAPFGQVVVGDSSGPERHPYIAEVENTRRQARPNITFMRVAVSAPPISLTVLERHPHSHQMFVPLNGTHQLVVVCPSLPSGAPDLAQVTAFVAAGGQAVNYAANVWHAPRMAIAGTGEFVMMRWDDGGEEDTQSIDLDPAIEIAVP
jgi:ureidoglycolate lyase